MKRPTHERIALAILIWMGIALSAMAQEALEPALLQAPAELPPMSALPALPPMPPSPFLPAVPERLEELIDRGMAQNADIKEAEARLQQAAAELRRVRLQIFREINEAQRERVRLQQRLDRFIAQGKRPEENEEMTEMQSEIAGLDMNLRYLLGMGPGGEVEPGNESRLPREPLVQRPRPAEPEALKTRLNEPVSVDHQMPLGDLLEFVQTSWNINIVCDVAIPKDLPVNGARDVPLRDLLTALTDQVDFLCFVLRDYGVLATNKERAQTMEAATIPENVPFYAPAPPLEERLRDLQGRLENIGGGAKMRLEGDKIRFERVEEKNR